jgi:hypothetical protein
MIASAQIILNVHQGTAILSILILACLCVHKHIPSLILILVSVLLTQNVGQDSAIMVHANLLVQNIKLLANTLMAVIVQMHRNVLMDNATNTVNAHHHATLP